MKERCARQGLVPFELNERERKREREREREKEREK